MNNHNMYGKYFKELRIKQNITLESAAKGVISISQLSRWENGKSNIPFDAVIKLLSNIHIRASEFISLCHVNPSSPIMQTLAIAYTQNDAKTIYSLAIKQAKKYEKSKSLYDLFLIASICNFYNDLTGQNILANKYLVKMKMILSNVSYWSQYYINVYCNTVSFYDSNFNFKISNKILNQIASSSTQSLDSIYYSWSAVLNSLTELIKNDLTLAKKLYLKLNDIDIADALMSIKFRREFLHQLIVYKISNDKNEEKISFLIKSLKEIGMSNLANDFNVLFSRIKEV